MQQPIYYWVPSIAPSGMAFYTGDKFARWKGDLFVGALRDQMLVRLRLDGEKVVKEERLLKGVLGRMLDSVTIIVAGAGTPTLSIPGAAAPLECRKHFMEATDRLQARPARA